MTPPDYDPEPEMSDGISVISDGDGQNTPPPVPENDISQEGILNDKNRLGFSFIRSGYRPLTPPPQPSTQDEPRETPSTVDLPRKREQKDLETLLRGRRFIGIYPRHVVFLMLCCGIVGGMIGHLWNLDYPCPCINSDKSMANLLNRLTNDKSNLEEQLEQCQKEAKKWSGHQEADRLLRVDNGQGKHQSHPYIPTHDFESMIWEHLTSPGGKPFTSHPEYIMPETQEEISARKSWQEGYSPYPEPKWSRGEEGKSRQKRDKKYEEKRRRHSSSGEREEDSHERVTEKQAGDRKEPKKFQGSGEKKKFWPKEGDRSQGKQKQAKYERGSGEQKRWKGSEEESGERKGDRKYQRKEFKKREGSASSEWVDKRNRGSGELRPPPQGDAKKSWKGSEREIKREETTTST